MYALIASAVSPARLRRGMRLFLSVFALSLLGGGLLAQTQFNQSTTVGNGTLGWTVNQNSGGCGFEGQSSYEVWSFGNFIYTPNGGSAQSLGGNATDYNSPGGNCPPNGGYMVQLSGNIQENGNVYFIDFYPNEGGSGTASLVQAPTATAMPLYSILSVIYDPPGNQSKNGFSTSVSNGITTGISNTFTDSSSLSITATGGFFAQAIAGVSFGYSSSTIDSSSFQFTTQSTNGSDVPSTSNQVDHTQDQVFLWLNPQVSIAQTGSNTLIYTMSNVGGQGQNIVNTRVANLQNPSLIPLWKLLPHTPPTGGTLPGLASICANPLPPSQCTQANACGCVPSDFAAIITAADPFFSPAAQSLSSSPTPDQVNQVDPNRFVYMESLPLEDTQEPYGISDSDIAFQSYGAENGYSVGYIVGGQIGSPVGFHVTVKNTNTFTWSNTKTIGSINGTANSTTLTLGTTNSDCGGWVDIYEDTVYHTFAPVREDPPIPGC